MTRASVSLRRIVALSVVLTLFAAPVASAQSRESAAPSAARPSTALLSPAAFVRLVQPPRTDMTSNRIVRDTPHIELGRLLTAPAAGRVPGVFTPAPAPQQRSWVARHKVATGVLIGIGVGLFLPGLIIQVNISRCTQNPYRCAD
jgi:hypothetical protein